MTPDHDDAGEAALAGIDLHAWRVPPPAALDRSLLVRALSPAHIPAKRPRLAWILAAIVLLNATIATLIVILLARPPAASPALTVQPAGDPTDARVRALLQRLEQEQRKLERRLAEIEELRALVVELAEKVRQYERDRTVRPRDRRAPDPVEQQPLDPFAPCDEVACVLSNYEGACCAKFRASRDPMPTANGLPDGIDRAAVSTAIAAVKGRVMACAARSTAKGTVKVRVQVSPEGRVTSAVVAAAPDDTLGTCVAAALSRAVFRRTRHGGSFSYPFVF